MSDLLRMLTTEKYSPQTIPGPRDTEIAELISTVVSREDFDNLASGLDLDSGRILNLFAKRAASLAVRRDDAEWIRLGLIAALLSGTVEDYREIARTNSLLFRAAELLGSDPVALFESAAGLADSDGAETARLFAHADESARSISVMGYREGTDEDGFRFLSLW